MSMTDAAAAIEVTKAKQDIATDPSLSFWGKVKAWESIDRAAAFHPEPKPLVSGSDVLKGAVGAGLGYGVGKAVASFYNVDPETRSTLQNWGAGLGTFLNLGVPSVMNKTSAEVRANVKIAATRLAARDQEIRDAVRIGFLKGAHETGLIDDPRFLEKGAMIAITPDTITAPIRATGGLSATVAGGLGAVGAGITGEDEADEEISRMMLEKRLIEQQADRLDQQRRNRVIMGILKKRMGDAKSATRF